MAAKQEPQEADLGDYTDYLILSSSDFAQGWRHNIMRLAPASSSDTTDVRHWTEAKLNRRDLQRIRWEEEQIARRAADTAREEEEAAAAAESAGLGADGMQVELKPGMPGYMAQQIKKEEEQRDDSKVAPTAATAGGKKPPRRGFGAPKKTRRIFVTEGSSKERRLRFEERHPWVLETEDDKKPPNETRWIGKMDSSTSAGAGEGSSYVCLVLDPHSTGHEAAFKVVPANRWYKFASRPKHHTLTADEAEAEFEKMQKASDLDMWFSSRRTNTGASVASTSDGTRGARGPDSTLSSGISRQTGGYRDRLAQARGAEGSQLPPSRMRTVYGSGRLGGNDVNAEAAGPSGRRAGKATVRPRRRDDDEREEFEFEEDFQDDEEGIGQVGDDALDAEENRQLEERIKREMREINAFGGGPDADEVDDNDTKAQLTKTGRRIQKLLKKRGRRARPEEDEEDLDDDEDDDDDDLKNPYASDENEDTDSEDESKRKQQRDGAAGGSKLSVTQPPPMSRNGSVSNGPKYPGGPSTGNSRSASPGLPGSRAASPGASPPQLSKRAASPTGSRPGSRAASPTPPPSATKRKADEGNSAHDSERGPSGSAGTTKRRKPGSPSPVPAPTRIAPGDDSALIAREEIIAFIRDNRPTTKELLKHFKAAMSRDPRNREVILQVTKEVAAIADGKLGLKPGVA